MGERDLARVALRPEDLALVAWNLVAVPIGALLGGGWSSDQPAPLLGLVQLLAMIGVIAALATRNPGEPVMGTMGFQTGFQSWAVAGPLVGAMALIGANTSERLGIGLPGVVGGLFLVAVMAAWILGERLPVLEQAWRRLLVAPFILVCAGFFDGFAAELLDGLDLPAMAATLFAGSVSEPELASLGLVLLIGVLGGSAAFYAMLILAPRELAAPEPWPAVWLFRYAVFALSAFVGAGAWAIV